MSAEFLLTSFIVALVPGTGAVYTVSSGLQGGWRSSLAAAVGCTLGIVPHLLTTLLGVSVLLHLTPAVLNAVKLAGIAYLVFLAWMTWRDSSALELGGQPGIRADTGRIVWRAVVLNLLNPKLTLFFLAFLPQFIARDTRFPSLQLLQLGTVFMVITLLVFVLYGILSSAIRGAVLDRPHRLMWLRRAFAVTFAALALDLSLTIIQGH